MDTLDAIIIQQACLEDVHELTILFDEYRNFYEQETDIDGAQTFLSARITNNDSVILLARSAKNKLMGFVQLYPLFSSVRMKSLWLLNDLYVTSNARGQGVATALIEQAKKLSCESHAAGIILETEKTNESAIMLYKKTGFSLDDQHYYFNWK